MKKLLGIVVLGLLFCNTSFARISIFSEGYTINEDEWDGKAVRLVAAWNTKDNDVDEFLEILKKSN